MATAQNDFDYYQRTIQQMYDRYYMKRIILGLVALAIFVAYTFFMKELLLLNGILILIIAVVTGYWFVQRQKFPEVYQAFLVENEPQLSIQSVEEAEYTYNIKTAGQVIRIAKKGARNLPSQNKQYTLLVGFAKNQFARQPLQIVYYDLLALTYEEKFRLSRNGYSRLPKFLRRFTWSNLKNSAGNAASLIFGNLFLLFILYRLIRYILAFLRMMF